MSIRLRLVLLYSGLLAALVTILCVSIYLFFAHNLDEEVNTNLRSRTQAVLNTTVASQNFWGRLQLDLPANAFNGEPVYIQTMDCDGNPGPRSNNLGNNYLPISDAAITNACENKDGMPTSTTLNNGTELRMLVSPIRIRGLDTIIGVIVVAQAMAPVKATLHNLAIVLITSGTAAVLLSLLLGWFVTRRALHPITTITETAHSIELSQDLSQRIAEPKVQDEVGQLAATFNRMLDRLQIAFTFQQRFVADSSHELRTPLTVIKGNASLLRMTDDPEEREESIRVIENEATRMNRIVDDLLLLAQLDNPTAQAAQRSEKLKRTVELDTMLLDVFKQARLMAGRLRVSLGHEDSATVLGDPDQLKQLLLNLVDNAVKYTPEDGSITLSLYREQGWAVVDVADTGVGISAEDLPHIWERFFRVDKARSREAGGTGLGLPIVRSIAVAHGGDVAAYSQPGQGSTFRVWLPLAPTAHAEPPTPLRGVMQVNPGQPFSTNGHSEGQSVMPIEQAVMMRQIKDLSIGAGGGSPSRGVWRTPKLKGWRRWARQLRKRARFG